MKILSISKLYSPWIGGVEKVAQQITEGLNGKDDLEIEVLCCQPKGRRKIEEINGVKVHKASSCGIFWGLPFSLDFFRLFKKLIKKVGVIALHHPFPLANLAIFLFSPKKKLIVHYHSDIVRQKILSFFYKPLISDALKKAEKIIVSNPNLIKSSPYLQKFQGKCKMVPFGVDLLKFEKFNEREIGNLKEKYGNFVLFVGRLNYYKGLEYLIEAMKDIEAKLVIIGDGSLKERLEDKLGELAIKNKVFLLPALTGEKLINFYKACTVFVLPSIFRSEAFGIVLIEAMAAGKPVVSTEVGTGTSFVNQNRVTGFVVSPKDSQALAQAIKKILGNKKLAQEFGQNALKRAREKFSLEKMLEEISRVYRDV